MKKYLSLLSLMFLLFGCSKTTEKTKEEIINQYRSSYGENWKNWPPEKIAEFKKEMASIK